MVCLGLLICDKCITGQENSQFLCGESLKEETIKLQKCTFFVFLGFLRPFKKRLNAVGESFFFYFCYFFNLLSVS